MKKELLTQKTINDSNNISLEDSGEHYIIQFKLNM